MPLPPLEVELKVLDLEASRHFYVDVLGFSIAYERPEERFISLRFGSISVLLEEPSPDDRVSVGALEPPLGRGINLQIAVDDAATYGQRCQDAGFEPLIALEERWYRVDDTLQGNRQCWVQDPDGYLLRFAEDLGTQPAAD